MFKYLLFLIPYLFCLKAEERPNIVFIMSDDHASEAISSYQSFLKDYAKTPNIDRLANEGMLFKNTFCNNSICSPSRASILTGQYSHANGVLNLNQKIHESSPYLTEELQQAGYQTWLVGKWHLGSQPRGFDQYKVVKGQGKYFDPTFYTQGGEVEKVEGYSSDVYTDHALTWLDQRKKDKPFCLLLHFKAPHHDYSYPERHNNLLKDVNIPEPKNLYEDVVNSKSPLKKEFLKTTKFHLSRVGKNNDYYERHVSEMEPHNPNDNKDKWRVAYQHMAKTYIRCVTAVDENVGRVLDYLDQQDLSQNTIVVYTADQGYWLGQHGFYDKRLIMEESLRMPLLIRYPKMIHPKSINVDLCSNVDFAPTLLDLCSVNIPSTMQGRSLKPLLTGHAPHDWRDTVYYRYYAAPPHTGIRTKTHTFSDLNGQYDLYNIIDDPAQMNNLAQDERYNHLINNLKQKHQFLEQTIGYSKEDVEKLNHDRKKLKSKKSKKQKSL